MLCLPAGLRYQEDSPVHQERQRDVEVCRETGGALRE